MARVRPEVAVGLSFLLTLGVVVNAFYHKKQFYPSVVYLTKSNSSMAVTGFILKILFYFSLLFIQLLFAHFRSFKGDLFASVRIRSSSWQTNEPYFFWSAKSNRNGGFLTFFSTNL